MEVERVFNTFLNTRSMRRGATAPPCACGLEFPECCVPAGTPAARGEGDFLRAGDAALDGGLVHAEKRRQPHAVLDNDNVRCPLPACLPGKIGFGVGNECGNAVEIPVEGRSVDLGIAFVRLGEGPQVQAQGQVPGGQQLGARNPPQGLAELFVRVNDGSGATSWRSCSSTRRRAARIRLVLSS